MTHEDWNKTLKEWKFTKNNTEFSITLFQSWNWKKEENEFVDFKEYSVKILKYEKDENNEFGDMEQEEIRIYKSRNAAMNYVRKLLAEVNK